MTTRRREDNPNQVRDEVLRRMLKMKPKPHAPTAVPRKETRKDKSKARPID
jgi:hypothetical protein